MQAKLSLVVAILFLVVLAIGASSTAATMVQPIATPQLQASAMSGPPASPPSGQIVAFTTGGEQQARGAPPQVAFQDVMVFMREPGQISSPAQDVVVAAWTSIRQTAIQMKKADPKADQLALAMGEIDKYTQQRADAKRTIESKAALVGTQAEMIVAMTTSTTTMLSGVASGQT